MHAVESILVNVIKTHKPPRRPDLISLPTISFSLMVGDARQEEEYANSHQDPADAQYPSTTLAVQSDNVTKLVSLLSPKLRRKSKIETNSANYQTQPEITPTIYKYDDSHPALCTQ